MAEAQLRQFLDKIRQLNAFVALSEADPELRQELSACETHNQVVSLAQRCGFEIGRRWGEPPPQVSQVEDDAGPDALQVGACGEPRPPAPFDPAAGASGLQSVLESCVSLFAGPCPPPGEECSERLLEAGLWRLERIHSCSFRNPPGFWYEQQEEEWVMVLQGTATLEFSDPPADHHLVPGDSLLIKAGRRHRVVATDPAPGTIWLALFWRRV